MSVYKVINIVRDSVLQIIITIFSLKSSNLISEVELHRSAYNNHWSSNCYP